MRWIAFGHLDYMMWCLPVTAPRRSSIYGARVSWCPSIVMHFYVATIPCGGRREKKLMQHGKKKLATTFFPVLIGLVSMLVAACGGASNSPTASQNDKASADKQIYVSPINVQNF